MKKIIAAFDSLKYSETTTRYAIRVAKECNAHLVGVFLDDYSHHSYNVREVAIYGTVPEHEWDQLEIKDKNIREESVKYFEAACQQAGVEYSIHHDKNIAVQELLHESIYADLIIIDKRETFSNYEAKMPSYFMRDLLSEVQCPVLAVPQTYNSIEKLVFLYDGSPASVYAIRSFSYLFPALKRLEVEIVSVKKEHQDLHLPDNKLMRELMKWHFPGARYAVLKGGAEDQILSYLVKQTVDTLIVLGAYQRNRVSRWFKASMADVLMEDTQVPLFIAHK